VGNDGRAAIHPIIIPKTGAVVFLGRYEHTIDSKGRLSIPVKFRQVLSEHYEERLIVTNEFDQCLVAYPREEWKQIEAKVKALPTMHKEVREWLRFFYSGAMDGALDRQGRVLLSPSLRDYAKLQRDVIIIGMVNKFEIWDLKRWKEREIEMPKSFERISEALAGLGL
jgi:MraZ protein